MKSEYHTLPPPPIQTLIRLHADKTPRHDFKKMDRSIKNKSKHGRRYFYCSVVNIIVSKVCSYCFRFLTSGYLLKSKL